MPLKAIVTKAGLDAHERGLHVVSRGLRDAGFEVVVLGLRTPPSTVADVAVQEDCDVVGVSSLAGGHLQYARKLRAALDKVGADPIVVFGGVIPDKDDQAMEEAGVSAIFRSGSMVTDMAARIEHLCNERGDAAHNPEEKNHG
jgi:methylmalonyl-CoA mutase cobalamin-binding domain/chain